MFSSYSSGRLGAGAVKIQKHPGTKSTNAKRAGGAIKIRKRPGTKSTKAKKAGRAFGDAEMPIPLASVIIINTCVGLT